MNSNYNNIFDLPDAFSDEGESLAYLKQFKWKDGEFCPYCGCEKLYAFSDGKNYKCAACRKRFSAKVGTLFENSKIPLQKWFEAIRLVTTGKKDISSYQLARDINVTQKTAWYMLDRLRRGNLPKAFNRSLSSSGIQDDETDIRDKENNNRRKKLSGETQNTNETHTTTIIKSIVCSSNFNVTPENNYSTISKLRNITEIVLTGSNVIANGINEAETNEAKPFVKWVGGKRSIINELIKRLPENISDYYEPFVGGGALFFAVHPRIKMAVLSDVNAELVLTYQVIKRIVHKLIEALKIHAVKHNDEYFYKIRGVSDLTSAVEVAARFVYLNKTCFNGLFRVNSKGEFNAASGKYVNPQIINLENLKACRAALAKARFKLQSYNRIDPAAGSFVYFDPPYHPASETAYFTQYSKTGFSKKDQLKLRNFVDKLTAKKVNIMLSNSNTPFIQGLYKDYNLAVVHAPRMVNCDSNKRNPVEEVIITNYDLPVENDHQ